MGETVTAVFTSFSWPGREGLAVWSCREKMSPARSRRKTSKKRVVTWSEERASFQGAQQLELSADDLSVSCSDNEYDYHEKVVDDINLRFFYQPRTLTLLCLIIVLLIYFALARDDGQSQESNIFAGLMCVCFWFVPVSLLCFPNGPFVRPHPAVWRIICGACFAYQLLLSFSLFQAHDDFRGFLVRLYPELQENRSDSTLDYAADCSLTVNNVWTRVDFFIIAHLLGHVVKALLLRNAAMVWFISIMWEITEMAFMHLLPNFAECWWDIIFMDVLLCNGVGIHLGIYLCHKLEMKTFKWASIKDIRSAKGKIRRMMMQFTPVSWTKIIELNIFFFKHIFVIPSNHPLLLLHHAFLVLSSAPSLRQYYLYVTDRNRERIGTQFWFFIANVLTETLIVLKFGRSLFQQISLTYLFAWIAIQIGLSMFAVYLIVYLGKPSQHQRRQQKSHRCSLPGQSSPIAYAAEKIGGNESSADESEGKQCASAGRTARSRRHRQD